MKNVGKGICIIALGAGIFGGGVYAGTKLENWTPFEYQVKKGFYENPYDLRIQRIKSNNKLEIYLTDINGNIKHKIDNNLYVGSEKHQLKGCYKIGKENIKIGVEKAGDALEKIYKLHILGLF